MTAELVPERGNVTQAKNDYNAAVLHFNTNDLLTTFISELTDLRDHAQAAYSEAIAVGGVSAGLLGNVQNRINGVTEKITLLSAGGLANVTKEIIDPCGANIRLKSVTSGDKTINSFAVGF